MGGDEGVGAVRMAVGVTASQLMVSRMARAINVPIGERAARKRAGAVMSLVQVPRAKATGDRRAVSSGDRSWDGAGNCRPRWSLVEASPQGAAAVIVPKAPPSSSFGPAV